MRMWMALLFYLMWHPFEQVYAQSPISEKSICGKYVQSDSSGTKIFLKISSNGKYKLKTQGSGYGDGAVLLQDGTWAIKNDTLLMRQKDKKALIPLMGHPPLTDEASIWRMIVENGELFRLDGKPEKRMKLRFKRCS